MGFFNKRTIDPEIRKFLERIVNDNPSYNFLTGKKREEVIQILAREIEGDLQKMVLNNLSETQQYQLTLMGNRAQARDDFIIRAIPNLNDKMAEVFERFYDSHTPPPIIDPGVLNFLNTIIDQTPKFTALQGKDREHVVLQLNKEYEKDLVAILDQYLTEAQWQEAKRIKSTTPDKLHVYLTHIDSDFPKQFTTVLGKMYQKYTGTWIGY